MNTKWLAAISGLALAACAGSEGTVVQPSTTAEGQCFYARDVNNFRVADRQNVYVSTRQGYVFKVSTPPGCFDFSTSRVSVEPYLGASQRICVGQQARVTGGGSGAHPMRCLGQVSGPVSEKEYSGLPNRLD